MNYYDRIPHICALVITIACAAFVATVAACLLHSEFKATTYQCHAGKDGIVHLPTDCARVS